MLTSRQQPQFPRWNAATCIRVAPAKHPTRCPWTPTHQNSTGRMVLVHRNVTCYPSQWEPVTLCASFFRKRCSSQQKTRQPAHINYRSTRAAQGVSVQKRPYKFYFSCDYSLSMLVALRTDRVVKGVAGVQRPYDR